MRVQRVVPNLRTADPAASARFFSELFGLQTVMDLGWIVTSASPEASTAQISSLSHDAGADVVPELSIEVDDVDAVHAAAIARGAEIVHPLTDEAWGVRRFFVRAPGGQVVNVLSHP